MKVGGYTFQNLIVKGYYLCHAQLVVVLVNVLTDNYKPIIRKRNLLCFNYTLNEKKCFDCSVVPLYLKIENQ